MIHEPTPRRHGPGGSSTTMREPVCSRPVRRSSRGVLTRRTQRAGMIHAWGVADAALRPDVKKGAAGPGVGLPCPDRTDCRSTGTHLQRCEVTTRAEPTGKTTAMVAFIFALVMCAATACGAGLADCSPCAGAAGLSMAALLRGLDSPTAVQVCVRMACSTYRLRDFDRGALIPVWDATVPNLVPRALLPGTTSGAIRVTVARGQRTLRTVRSPSSGLRISADGGPRPCSCGTR